MKIIRARIPKESPPRNDLGDIEMDQLGQLILLAGRNGSGKSRLLEKIANAVTTQPKPHRITELKSALSSYMDQKKLYSEQLLQWEDPAFNITVQGPQRDDAITKLKGNLQNNTNNIDRLTSELGGSHLDFQDDSELRKIVHFMPKKLDLRDPKSLNEEQREDRAKKTHSLGVTDLHENVLCKIQELHTKFWHATHQHSKLLEVEKVDICNEYEQLQVNLEELLGARLSNNSRGDATLFNLPIGAAKLSDGQKVLLQLAVAIHCQGIQLSETILLLDEPENHIHPSAIIEVLELLVKKIADGQIWVATHSVSLLAHFAEFGSLWYMDGGKVSPAGKIQEKVLQGLLGDETRIARQREFLEKPERVALIRYAQQCLCPPVAVMTGTGDPQIGQIQKAIEDLYEKHGRLKLLDFGAGQGRLLANFGEDISAPQDIPSKLDYVAYDEYAECKEICNSQIHKVYGSSEGRWFGSYHDLLATHNKDSFNLVVMCNVLHEILPKRWEELFGPNGEITELLTDDGNLLIVEDQRIPAGENAHKYGFIVLDTGALKDLFGVQGNDQPILSDSKRDGRLKAHLVSKDQLRKVSRATVRKALECHIGHSRKEIDRIRGTQGTSDGRTFAFWLVQYANVVMSMENYRE